MNASVEWLSAFVESGLTPTQLRDLITARAVTVDEVVPLRADLAGLVVGQVETATRHPDSDHLWLATVDAGGPEPFTVVCGAPNVTVGVRYAFAPVGVTMPNGMKIERRKIRGQTLNGMLCSARELGLGEEHDGILPLTTEARPGTPVAEVLPAGDARLVIDVGPNRPDLLSHLGVAREVAAATGRPLHEDTTRGPATGGRPATDQAPAVPPPVRSTATGDTAGVRVTVDDAADCPTYLGVVLRGVRVGPSPDWLVARLAAVGVRSISNVVDVTNYLLHGYGQPMHAFDLARLSGPEVRVRRARRGERLVGLDGVDRALDDTMLVIADAERVQALAGVMGGQSSEVKATTTDLFVEIAAFDPGRVRATRRALGLSTDASYRFERLVPATLPSETYDKAVRMLGELTGGVLAAPPALIGRPPAPRPPLTLRSRRVAQVLGVDVPATECARLLSTVGFARAPVGDDLAVTPPTWRTDVTSEIDLVEEVARLRGYGSFPDELRPYRLGTVPDDPLVGRADRLRDLLVGRGFLEVRPMPFVADAAGDGMAVRVTNPLSENESYLRTDLLTTLARRAEHNLAHMQGDLRLFEMGTVFRRGGQGREARPTEEVHVAVLCMGARRPPHFTEPTPPVWDEWDAKALGEAVASVARPAAGGDSPAIELRPVGEHGELWQIRAVGRDGRTESVGRVARVSLDAPPWAAPAYGVEVTVAETEVADVAPEYPLS